MSRKYMNGRWCVRCNKTDPTPYLRKWAYKLMWHEHEQVVDLGCGNGRNSYYLLNEDPTLKLVALDMSCTNNMAYKLPYGDVTVTDEFVLGEDRIPLKAKTADIILANYSLMFLDVDTELQQVLREITRVAAPMCRLMIELYPAKDSVCPDAKRCLGLLKFVHEQLVDHGWAVLRDDSSQLKSIMIRRL